MPTHSDTPLWRKYLDALPDAEHSYPECLVKGSVVRSLLDSSSRYPKPNVSALPSMIRDLVETPPLPNTWLSEVGFNALMLAYQDAISRSQFEAWVYERNKKLLASPLYRILFLVVSPERLFVGVPQRWAAFRRGSSLELLWMRGASARLALTFPSYMHDEITLASMTIALKVAAEAAGAKGAEVQLHSLSPVRAEIDTSW